MADTGVVIYFPLACDNTDTKLAPSATAGCMADSALLSALKPGSHSSATIQMLVPSFKEAFLYLHLAKLSPGPPTTKQYGVRGLFCSEPHFFIQSLLPTLRLVAEAGSSLLGKGQGGVPCKSP